METLKNKTPIIIWLLVGIAVAFPFLSEKKKKGPKALTVEQQAELDCRINLYEESNQRTIESLKFFNPTDYSVEHVIQDRRLQEDFCIRLMNCSQKTGDAALDNFMLVTSFEDCLNEPVRDQLIDSGEFIERR